VGRAHGQHDPDVLHAAAGRERRCIWGGEMMPIEPSVFVVDDDPAMRRSMLALLSAQGIRTETYPSGREFLASFDPQRPGCVVLDLLLRGESGIDVLDHLRSRPLHPPVIVLTAHGSVPASVQVLRAGAFDFIEKPMRPATLLARIREAFEADAQERVASEQRSVIEERARRLSARERTVAGLLMTGKRSKEIADE